MARKVLMSPQRILSVARHTIFFGKRGVHQETLLHALTPAPLAAAAASLLSLPADDASRAALAGNSLLRRLLYESSELQTVDAVRALLPRGLDARLEGLLSGVRGRLSSARCRVLVCAPFHPSLTRSHFFIFSAFVRC